jgi:hypothetical protein
LLIFYIIFISLFSFYAILPFAAFTTPPARRRLFSPLFHFDFRLLITRQPLLAADIRCHADADIDAALRDAIIHFMPTLPHIDFQNAIDFSIIFHFRL